MRSIITARAVWSGMLGLSSPCWVTTTLKQLCPLTRGPRSLLACYTAARRWCWRSRWAQWLGICVRGEQQVVGVEINANHLRAATQGYVKGICRPLHVGRRNQVWQIEIFDEHDKLFCISRLTTMVIDI